LLLLLARHAAVVLLPPRWAHTAVSLDVRVRHLRFPAHCLRVCGPGTRVCCHLRACSAHEWRRTCV
jgi:hypothetical protein